MWGIVTEVTLRLEPRRKLALRVETAWAAEAVGVLEARQRAGAWHGDWQFAIDPSSPGFMKEGILTSYSPVESSREVTRTARVIDEREFTEFAALAHTQPGRAFELYAQEWTRQSGEVEWSDAWQASDYLPDYHSAVDRLVGATVKGTEVLSEFYVPRRRLAEFLERAAGWIGESGARLVFGVVRLIRPDKETLLAWAQEDQACVILNLHADHSEAGLAGVQSQLRGIAQIAVELTGRFYLTYGRFADREQLLRGYPQLPEWVRRKRRHDPSGVLRSDWFDAMCRTIEV
jgi:FAD/FMN-containing dehydrogenase